MNVDQWKNLIIYYLGFKLKQRISEIKNNIKFVDLGLKLLYLLDFGVKFLQFLINFVKDLNNN